MATAKGHELAGTGASSTEYSTCSSPPGTDFSSKGLYKRAQSPSCLIEHEDFLTRPDIRGQDEYDVEADERRRHVTPSLYKQFRRKIREPLSEMLGSAILIIIGDASVAQALLSRNDMGNEMTINLCFGVGLTLGYLTAVSGGAAGHLNPAITLANCIFRGFPWRKLPIYILAQLVGCGVGAACVFGIYRNATTAYDGGQRQVTGPLRTAGIYSTYPVGFLDLPGRAMQEFFATIVLVLFVNAVACQNSPHLPYKLPMEWHLVRAFALGLALFGIGASLGWQTGYAMNPARDFAPRLVSFMAGYGREVFTTAGHYFWIPIVMPCVGAITGQLLFDFIVYEDEHDNFVTNPTAAVKRLKENMMGRKKVRETDIEMRRCS
ncbi:aquaporin-like protein [Lipomyces kononenkoae]|uniref:Aquaporin-like protein n=1 Tax=Lipomyces kononenkoae TaxID=34357 RepID=A0ACC3T7Z3_LIPKO